MPLFFQHLPSISLAQPPLGLSPSSSSVNPLHHPLLFSVLRQHRPWRRSVDNDYTHCVRLVISPPALQYFPLTSLQPPALASPTVFFSHTILAPVSSSNLPNAVTMEYGPCRLLPLGPSMVSIASSVLRLTWSSMLLSEFVICCLFSTFCFSSSVSFIQKFETRL